MRFQRLHRHGDRAGGAAAGSAFRANFNQPYRAQRLREFWQRWHISLSTWLRDYLYKPLGGNRHGRLKTYRNLMITMLLGGIWHGAAWKFVIWGALHGGGLAVERMLEPWLGRRADEPAGADRLDAGRVPFRLPRLDLLPGRGFRPSPALFIAGLGAGWGERVQQAGSR